MIACAYGVGDELFEIVEFNPLSVNPMLALGVDAGEAKYIFSNECALQANASQQSVSMHDVELDIASLKFLRSQSGLKVK